MRSARASPAEIGLEMCDRRRSVRYKLQLSAYASLVGTASTQPPARMKIVDLSENGMGIQPSFPLEPGQRRTSLLRLPYSQSLIRADVEVVRTDASGRAGLRFYALPEESLSALRLWLFSRIAKAAEAIPQRPIAQSVPRGSLGTDATPIAALEHLSTPAQPDYTTLLAAVEAVQPELEAVGGDRDLALHLIARRAQEFTQASGAALALAEGEEMVCRASVDDAPPSGTHFRIGSGFSGECVRSGSPLRCDDSDTDPRVDHASCRAIGLRSILAVPIRSQSVIIGLLEVFSRRPQAFGPEDELILLRLAKMAAATGTLVRSPADSPTEAPVEKIDLDEAPSEESAPQLARWMGLLIKVAITVSFVIFGVIRIWEVDSRSSSHRSSSQTTAGPATSVSLRPLDPPMKQRTTGLPELLQLADQGDAAAQFALGVRYETGDGVPQDDQEAVHWFNKAAEQDEPGAQGMLGAYYWAGRSVPADPVKAYFWSILAKTGGDEASKSRVALLASRLKHSQILDAQQQANNWMAQHRPSSPLGGSTEQ
ncbi:MAG TPA: GAF domain-containing protein [Terriglobales bacterium]|nr:GAF domain-containing protein [Terriglobales bacterium]